MNAREVSSSNSIIRPRVLRIFNRYLQRGGEEAAARRIHRDLGSFLDACWFEYSTQELLGTSPLARIAAGLNIIHNAGAVRTLRTLQAKGGFHVWEVHNVFPALSPAVYAEAFRQEVKVVQYLHNYRLSCVNGMFLNHGVLCRRCIDGNFWPAVQTACWHDRRAACAGGALALVRIRRLNVFQRVHVWVALSEAQKQLHVRMGIPETKIHVVPHYLEPVTAEPDVPPPDGYVLFIGRLSPEKGVTQLLRAWRLVQSSGARLVIAGTGPAEGALHAQARHLKNVEFRGFVPAERHAELWAGAKFLVAPSIWDEPFGLVVLEAWAHGRPVLTSDRGAFPEIVGQAGLTCPPDKPQALAAQIDHLLSDVSLARGLAEAGRDRLVCHFSRRRWLEGMQRVYKTIGAGFSVTREWV
jgi:glycosyltransferase involved in cell wall biosynthesis